jgi:predicted NBD/HSP70 family sugar kinase
VFGVSEAMTRWVPVDGSARDVALEVLLHGPLSRSELARRLGLSPGSVTRLTKPLLDAGMLVEAGVQREARIGRPSLPLDVVESSRHFVGVKLTGQDAHAVLVTLRANVVASRRITLSNHEPQNVVSTVASLVRSVSAGAPHVSALGVTLGGEVSPSDVIHAPFLDWDDLPLAAMLGEATGLPTVVENDVTALTEAEHWFGAGRGCDRFAILTIGAGVGYGLVVHDQLVSNADSGVGLVGHWQLDPLGPLCDLGHRGCAAQMLTIGGITASTSVGLRREVAYDECLDLAMAGNPVAQRVVSDSGRALGRLVAAVANLTMPDKVIITGDGVRLAHVASTELAAGIAEHRHPRARPVPVEVDTFDFAEWARGAAVVAIQTHVLADA